MDKRSNEFYELIDSLNAFMTENKFDQELRQRLRAFFRYRRRNATVQEYQVRVPACGNPPPETRSVVGGKEAPALDGLDPC